MKLGRFSLLFLVLLAGSEYSDYWRWAKTRGDGKIAYRNRIPHLIVEILERHGFI
jgi:hypothetical protein